MTYEQLDAIADSYLPILLVLCLCTLVWQATQKGYRFALKRFFALFVSTAFIYSVMFLDNHFGIWPTLGLDYSTHTALGWVFVVFLASINKRWAACVLTSMGLYILLMLYQEYHSILDILTTSLVVLPPIAWVTVKVKQHK